ncbi:hypothetical protein P7K49_001606, partial [Saguinus oedipus]
LSMVHIEGLTWKDKDRTRVTSRLRQSRGREREPLNNSTSQQQGRASKERIKRCRAVNRVKEVQRQMAEGGEVGKVCKMEGLKERHKNTKKEGHGVQTKVKIEFISRKKMGLILRHRMVLRDHWIRNHVEMDMNEHKSLGEMSSSVENVKSQ